MRRAGRLTRHDHRSLRGSGSRASSGPVTVSRFPSPDTEPARVGFAVSTAIGGAVARNRVRRRLAAALQTCSWHGPMIVSARQSAATLGFRELQEHLARAIDAAGRKANR